MVMAKQKRIAKPIALKRSDTSELDVGSTKR
jgi:hypothetical protein